MSCTCKPFAYDDNGSPTIQNDPNCPFHGIDRNSTGKTKPEQLLPNAEQLRDLAEKYHPGYECGAACSHFVVVPSPAQSDEYCDCPPGAMPPARYPHKHTTPPPHTHTFVVVEWEHEIWTDGALKRSKAAVLRCSGCPEEVERT